MAALLLLLLGWSSAAAAQVLVVESPAANGTVGQPFWVSGYALHQGGSGTGVNAMAVYGCKVSNCTWTYWGAGTYGVARPDVAAVYGNQYLNSGYQLVMSGLTVGAPYQILVYAFSTITGQWSAPVVVTFTPTATPILTINGPMHGQSVAQPFQFAGWAIDGSAPTGTGVSTVDIWSYPNPGSGTAPIYVGSGGYGVARSDVSAVYGSRFLNSGYSLWKAGLVPGEHLFVTYALSTASNTWFFQTTTNYVDIPTVPLTIDRQGTGTGGVTAAGLSCPGGASTQAVPCAATYAFNTVVTLTAVPDAGNTFGGWSGACTGDGHVSGDDGEYALRDGVVHEAGDRVHGQLLPHGCDWLGAGDHGRGGRHGDSARLRAVRRGHHRAYRAAHGRSVALRGEGAGSGDGAAVLHGAVLPEHARAVHAGGSGERVGDRPAVVQPVCVCAEQSAEVHRPHGHEVRGLA